MARFNANLRPAEAKIAEKLKPRMHNTSTKQVRFLLLLLFNTTGTTLNTEIILCSITTFF